MIIFIEIGIGCLRQRTIFLLPAFNSIERVRLIRLNANKNLALGRFSPMLS